MSIKVLVSVATAALCLAARPPGAYAQDEQGSRAQIDPKKKLLWLDVQGGVESARLDTFTADFNAFSVGFLPRSGVGPAVTAGAGVRLVFLTLGVRGRVASFDEADRSRSVGNWTMSSIDGEIGLRAPLGRFEPYFAIAAGYTTLGGIGDAVSGLRRGVSANGGNGRLALGFDYFLTGAISVGARASGDVIGLTRPGVPLREVTALPQSDDVATAATRALSANGSSWGTALAFTGGLSAHF